jgi:glycosyltransferase involved in cell wall biosynthesis
MKIGLVLSSAPGYSETFLTNKINGLLQHGFDVKLFVSNNRRQIPSHYKVYTQPAVRGNLVKIVTNSLAGLSTVIICHPYRSIRYIEAEIKDGSSIFKAIKSLIYNSHILTENLDWLHFGFGTNALGRENIAAAIDAKMSVSFRGFDIAIYPLKVPDCYKKLWLTVDKVHVISDDLNELAISLGLKEEVPAVKITPAIDVGKFSYTGGKRLQSEIGIITTGRLMWKKGYEYALLAMKLLKERGINFHYTIVGEGEDHERLIFARHQLGLDGEVTFTGKLSHENVLEELKKQDIYLQPSVQEGFCNATLEAQATGLLCIVTDAEGLPENVLNNKTGWVVPKRSSLAIADKIEEVIKTDPEALEDIRLTASERIAKEFNLHKQQKEFIKFFTV